MTKNKRANTTESTTGRLADDFWMRNRKLSTETLQFLRGDFDLRSVGAECSLTLPYTRKKNTLRRLGSAVKDFGQGHLVTRDAKEAGHRHWQAGRSFLTVVRRGWKISSRKWLRKAEAPRAVRESIQSGDLSRSLDSIASSLVGSERLSGTPLRGDGIRKDWRMR